ncbi:hypothetical protein HQ585_18270 [candidate division KSB1 bacterium]|nr:hypothetical protein [candidate division KSB1 bacterium]
MASQIRRVDYFNTTVDDQPGESCAILSQLAGLGINLLAFSAVPIGPTRTQLSIFPDDPHKLTSEADRAGILLDGPHSALLVQGDDQLGALAEIHKQLYQANVNLYASNCVTDGKGDYGYIIYIRPDEFDRAASALGI